MFLLYELIPVVFQDVFLMTSPRMLTKRKLKSLFVEGGAEGTPVEVVGLG